MCVSSRSPRPRIVPKRRIARGVGLYRLHRRMRFKFLSLAWCLAKADHAHAVCHPAVYDGQLKGLHPSADAIARVKSCLKSEMRQAILVYSNMLLNPASSIAERSTLYMGNVTRYCGLSSSCAVVVPDWLVAPRPYVVVWVFTRLAWTVPGSVWACA
jgi:hypothetical protein